MKKVTIVLALALCAASLLFQSCSSGPKKGSVEYYNNIADTLGYETSLCNIFSLETELSPADTSIKGTPAEIALAKHEYASTIETKKRSAAGAAESLKNVFRLRKQIPDSVLSKISDISLQAVIHADELIKKQKH